MSEHATSKRGGWGVRLHGCASFPHPDGSALNCYSLGDVVAYDSESEALAAADAIIGRGMYRDVTVEPVVKGQTQSSIMEAKYALELAAAIETEREACAKIADLSANEKWKMSGYWSATIANIAEAIRARGAK